MGRVPRTPRDSTIIQEITSKNLREFYRWMVEVSTKLEGTDTTLADEEKKSISPLIGMIHDIDDKLESLKKDTRSLRSEIESVKGLEHENRILRAEIKTLSDRISHLEGEI